MLRSYLEILIDTSRPSLTTQHRQMCTVAYRSRPLSSQLLVHRPHSRDHPATRVYLFISIPSSSQPPHHRPASPKSNGLFIPWPQPKLSLHGRTLHTGELRNIIPYVSPQIIDHRSCPCKRANESSLQVAQTHWHTRVVPAPVGLYCIAILNLAHFPDTAFLLPCESVRRRHGQS